MLILDPLHTDPYYLVLVLLSNCFSAAAKQRSVYRTIFIATQLITLLLRGKWIPGSGRIGGRDSEHEILQSIGWYNFCPRENRARSKWDREGVENAAGSSAKRGGATERRSERLGQPGEWERKIEASFGCQKTKTDVGGSS
jgi:hypothetical protein